MYKVVTILFSVMKLNFIYMDCIMFRFLNKIKDKIPVATKLLMLPFFYKSSIRICFVGI